MTAVFLSYAPDGRDLAGRIVRGLKAAGIDAWWDQDLAGIDWRQALERQIGELGAIVVLWTPASQDDPAVKDAARLALPTGKLINVTTDGASPPFPYGSADSAPLSGWTDWEGHAGWTKLVELIAARTGASRDGALKDTVKTTWNKSDIDASEAGRTRPQAGDRAQNLADNQSFGDDKTRSKVIEQVRPPEGGSWLRVRRIAAIMLVCGALAIVGAVFSSVPPGPSPTLNETGVFVLCVAFSMVALAYNLWKKIPFE